MPTAAVFRRALAPLRRPTGSTMWRAALAAVAVNILIVLSGGLVRLTASGLGCPTWPNCTGDSLTPTHDPVHGPAHMAIEFGNRLVTFLVLAAAVVCVIVARRLQPRRRDLVILSWLLPLGVVAQIVLGGITVLVKLDPTAVAAHFLLSMAIIVAAVALLARSGEGDAPPSPLVGPELRLLGRALTAAMAVLLALGTVVTGTGPHAGDAAAPRYGFRIADVAQLHADVVWITVGLTFAMLLATRLTGAPLELQRRVGALFVLELVQGAVGYVQYFTGVPAGLVAVHVLLAAVVWAATVWMLFGLRSRGPVPAETGRASERLAALS